MEVQTMEIIKAGNKNQAECQDCGSVLKFAASDIMRRTVSFSDPDYYHDGPDYRYTIKCASCNMLIEVTDRITPGIAKIVAERAKYEDHDL